MAEVTQPRSDPSDGSAAEGSVWCVVVAGGSGTRFGEAKQFALLAGERVVDRAVATAAAACDGVVLVLPAEAVGTAAAAVPGADVVVAGGATRVDSGRAGLAAVPADVGVVLVHDAARPLAGADLFARVVAAVRAGAPAVVPAVAVTDTIRHVDGRLLDRSTLRAVQTPQGFTAEVLRSAHAAAAEAPVEATTDDAGLVEATGVPIGLIEGEITNIKLTAAQDLLVAEALLAGGAVAVGGGASR